MSKKIYILIYLLRANKEEICQLTNYKWPFEIKYIKAKILCSKAIQT